MIKINVTMEFSEEWLESVVCSALEGGSNYWINDGFKSRTKQLNNEDKFFTDAIAHGNAFIRITDIDDVIDKDSVWIINRETFITGYERYCAWKIDKGYKLYTDASDIDGDEADIILQLGLFNEIIFG